MYVELLNAIIEILLVYDVRVAFGFLQAARFRLLFLVPDRFLFRTASIADIWLRVVAVVAW